MDNKITILQVCPRLGSGGIERGTVDVAIALKQAGYHSIVASGGGEMVKELSKAGVEHFELPLYLKSPHGILRNSRLLRDIIVDWNIELVHARSRAPIWVTRRAIKGLDNVHLVTSCHSPHGKGFLNLKKIYNRPISSGERVIAISEFIANYLQHNYHVPDAKLRTIHRGIDMQFFNPENITPNIIPKFKDHYKIPQDKKVILLPGRITRWKGQDTFIKALAQIANSHSVHGVIVGRVDSQDYHKELAKLVADLHLKDNITFIDECFNMPLLYKMADITISSSRKPEAFGRVAVEGQAMQSIVIATNLGATCETVVPNKTGFLIAPNNPQQLADTIKHVLSLPEEDRNYILRHARQHVEKSFSKKNMLNKTLNVYKECLT
jgi:glycosyltransferase involved in cell wall biosynthesis